MAGSPCISLEASYLEKDKVEERDTHGSGTQRDDISVLILTAPTNIKITFHQQAEKEKRSGKY